MLKFIVLGAFVFFGSAHGKEQRVQLSPEKIALITQASLQCASEVGVDPALLIQIRQKKYSDDENVKKFLLCTFKKTGVASKKGSIKTDKFLDIYPEKADKEAIKKVVIECQQENGEPLEKVFNFFKCYQENTTVHIA